MKYLSTSSVLELIKVAGTSFLALIFYVSSANAAPIIIQQTNQFCDARSVNDVNFGIGNFLTITADLTPDGDLTNATDDGPPDGRADSDDVSSPSNVFASQDTIVNRRLNYFPLPGSPNHFARSVVFNCDLPGVPDLRDEWSLSISNDTDNCVSGICTLEDGTPGTNPITPHVRGVPHVNFINSFTFQVTSDPTTPLFRWKVPANSNHDSVTIWIQDLQQFIGEGGVGGGGIARVVRSQRLVNDASTCFETCFQVPDGWLQPNHLYSVSIQLDRRRPVQPPPFGRLESRSRAFFSFQTVNLPTGGAPVHLPSVNPDAIAPGQPVYEFRVLIEQPGQTTFIDPPLAIGYDYQTGSGDPNFKSVLLPPVGNNMFDVYLWNGTKFIFHATVGSGVEFPFPAGGIDRFRVLGIESSAALDPNNPTAFVTGLTFMSAGQFTGTMTPIVAEALCSTLGDDPKPSLLDQDIYTLQGTQGEELRVRLEGLTSNNKQASLILLDNIHGAVLLKTDSGTLPNEVSAVLPATGEYLAIVGEHPLIARGNRFRGDYCVSVQSSGTAAQTLQPTGWVE